VVGIRHGICVTVAVLATAASTAGCVRAATAPGPVGAPAPTSSTEPYDLYTHCGIREANIDGRWFVASDPVWDGAVNPPSGWGNPYQHGTMTLRSATEAVFTDAAGHRVVFTLRPGATGPLELCA
jgi:hypothetical protein